MILTYFDFNYPWKYLGLPKLYRTGFVWISVFEGKLHVNPLILFVNCQNPNLISTQQLGFTRKWLYTTTTTTTTTTHRNSMSAISQLLLTRFCSNFKVRFLGTSRTNSNCYGAICPDNICLGHICPDQEYISCYWFNFYKTLKVGFWDHL